MFTKLYIIYNDVDLYQTDFNDFNNKFQVSFCDLRNWLHILR